MVKRELEGGTGVEMPLGSCSAANRGMKGVIVDAATPEFVDALAEDATIYEGTGCCLRRKTDNAVR